MSPNIEDAARFIASRLESGELTHEDIVRLVADYQARHGLAVDGKPGAATLAALRPQLMLKAFPLPELADGRRPVMTSGFKSRNASRPTHNGCDFFYHWRKSDGPVRMGDGGATRGPGGQPKWFIPAGTKAIAAAAGVVSTAGPHKTGHCVWINHADGYRSGYFHLQDTFVAVGQVVALGTPVGTVGDNPLDIDAQHLHFEVSPVGSYAPIDPEVWLRGATYWT